jgi:hypothetical protein
LRKLCDPPINRWVPTRPLSGKSRGGATGKKATVTIVINAAVPSPARTIR